MASCNAAPQHRPDYSLLNGRLLPAPLDDSIFVAIARLMGDARSERREPSHSIYSFSSMERTELGARTQPVRWRSFGCVAAVICSRLWRVSTGLATHKGRDFKLALAGSSTLVFVTRATDGRRRGPGSERGSFQAD
jgi:hypothetical protein